MERDDETKILNLIADIRSLGDELESREEEKSKLQLQLESLEDEISSDREEIRRKRDELDSILDELIPDRDVERDTGSGYGLGAGILDRY